MIWLRSLLFFLSLVLYTPPYAVFCLVSFPFLNEHQRYQLIQFWGKSIIFFLEFFCGVRYQVIGMEHANAVRDQAVVILSKHQSAWETIAYLNLFPKDLCYVFKRELLWIPFFGWVMGLLNMIHIDRSAREFRNLGHQSRKGTFTSREMDYFVSRRNTHTCWLP